jgi:hypothetical protein
MFIGKFVKKLFKKDDKKKKGEKKLKTRTGQVVKEETKKEIIKNSKEDLNFYLYKLFLDEYEIYQYGEFDQNGLINDYMDVLSKRTVNIY